MLEVGNLLSQQTAEVMGYKLSVAALDKHCNSVKIKVEKEEKYFEQTISIYDFVDVRKKLKEGQSMEEINKYSLLFLKLMIADKNRSQCKIVELSEVPWKKILRGEQAIAKTTSKRAEDGSVKGICLLLTKNLAVVVPLVLVNVPKQKKKMSQSELSETVRQIKSIFYDEIKSTDLS